MRVRALLVLLALSASGCGGASTPPSGGGRPGGGTGTRAHAAENANGGGGGGGESTSSGDGFATYNLELRADGSVSLGPGFRPSPVVLAGQNGGSVDAYALGSTAGLSCYGYLPDVPQHVVDVTAPMPSLRVVVDTYRASDASGAYGSIDSTLFVRDASGRIWCDDDSGGDLQPVLDIPMLAPGRLEIFVGAYSATGTGAYYKLALTENPAYTHSDLR